MVLEEEVGHAEEKEGGGSSRATTRGMQVHDHELYHDFVTYLTSRAGGNKSVKNAKGVATNVAKFHFHANSHEAGPLLSLKAKKVRAFIDHCEKMGIGPSGLIQKILDIESSIKFLLYQAEDTEEEGMMSTKASATMTKFSLLRRSFRGENNKREREALEDLASDLPSLDAVKNVWESEEGTMHFRRAMEGLSHTPTKSDYNTALAILAGRLLFR